MTPSRALALALLVAAAGAAAAASPLPNNDADAADVAELKPEGLTDYGNWCGGGHGGYQDCCDGGRCPSCDPDAPEVTPDCLAECPPVDALDLQCAHHDRCCDQNPKKITCLPEGNRCACDCQLIRGADAAHCGTLECDAFRAGLKATFEHVLSCFYYGSPEEDAKACHPARCPKGWCTECQGDQSCDIDLDHKYAVTDFCKSGFPTSS